MNQEYVVEKRALVHMLTEVWVKGAVRYSTVKCGAEILPFASTERPFEWTAYNSRVTCPDCKWKPHADQ